MRTVPRNLAAALALALPFAVWAAPQAQKPATPPAAPPAHDHAMAEKAPAAGGVRADLLAALDDARDKLIALAEAMPADKYGWRPGEGVRSVGEVFAHVSVPNYLLPTAWGATAPPNAAEVRDLEKSGADKAKMVEALRGSFAHADEAIGKLTDADLDREIQMFGQKSTVRQALLLLVSHAHEHLGQSIAYARTNGVVPPWSAREGRQGG